MSEAGVVVGTDGSESSLRAVEWAAQEAWRREVPLRIISVAELWPYDEPPGKTTDAGAAKSAAYAEQQAAEVAAKLAVQRIGDLTPDLAIETSVLGGSPAEQLIASAAGSQLLVVGCRGSGGFSGLVLGSISRFLATHAPLPVVVVREETVPSDREIVVGVRSPRQANAALRFGFAEAALRGASLLAIEAMRPGRLAAAADVNGDVLAATTSILREHLDAWRSRFPDVTASQEVVLAHPGRLLAAASARADLVVLGRHGSHSGALGAVIHAVLTHASGPVAVVPGD
jgi:nucleotide-binding universal stress UspA family protein